MKIPKGGIGFFDSGIGGLTVLNACKKRIPSSIFYYYGDNFHAPYGNLPERKIKKYVFQAMKRFQKLRASAVVIACNTVTAVCIEDLRKRFSFPIIGAEPAVFLGAKVGGEVFVLSTRATYNSSRFQALCKRANEKYPQCKITAYACDRLAGEIEKNIGKGEIDLISLLPRGNPRTVVLGCTHYVYIAERIKKFYGCETVDGNEGIAIRLQAILSQKIGRDHLQPLTLQKREKSKCKKSLKATQKAKKIADKNANERSCLKSRNSVKIKEQGQIYFLGKSKKINEKTNKQMFV